MLFGLSYLYGLTGSLEIDQAISSLAPAGALGGNKLAAMLTVVSYFSRTRLQDCDGSFSLLVPRCLPRLSYSDHRVLVRSF